MSETPRTDAAIRGRTIEGFGRVEWVEVSFARELEREISALKSGEHLLFSQRLVPKLEAENAALREEVDSLKSALAALALASMEKREDEL